MDFPSNSHNLNEPGSKPEKKVEKVVSGEVLKRPKSIGRRFTEIFSGNGFKTASKFVMIDILFPALRNLIYDTGNEGLRRMQDGLRRSIYKDNSSNRQRFSEYRPRIQYNNPINRFARDPRDPRELRDRTAYLPNQPPYSPRGARIQVGDLILVSRAEAEIVLERLIDIIDKYEVASVADLYDLVGLPTSYIDNKWGWSMLTNVEIRQVREGYLIDLPPVEPI